MDGAPGDGVLAEFLLMLALAAGGLALLRHLALPGVIGYLLVGAFFGPHALGWISGGEYVELIAQLGVVLLLFTIGLEFSVTEITRHRQTLLPLGLGQVVLTTAGVGAVAWLAGFGPAAAFAVGAVLAQSSTSIIAKQLLEQGEQTARHGRLALGISVFQDVTAIPFVIAIPALAIGGAGWLGEMTWLLGLALVVMVVLWAVGRWLLRPLLHHVAATRSLELFTLVSVVAALGAAWVTEQANLSLALGGFLAGMVLSESAFQHQVEAVIRPFRDLLLGLFFITIGMQLELLALPGIAHWVLALAFGSIVFKTLLVWLLCRIAGVDRHRALRTGLVLAVGGEFGFALLALSLDAGLLDPQQKQILLGAVLISMLLTPLLIRYNLAIADRLTPIPEGPRSVPQEPEGIPRLEGHVVLCGYGRVGQNIARFLRGEGVSYIAVDADPARVRDASLVGEPVFFGDAREPHLLQALRVEGASLAVVTYDDLPAAERTLQQIQSLNPAIPVVVRTEDEHSMERLRAAGATECVAETMEASLMLVAHALEWAGLAPERVRRIVDEARRDRYRLLRDPIQGAVPVPREGAPLEPDRGGGRNKDRSGSGRS